MMIKNKRRGFKYNIYEFSLRGNKSKQAFSLRVVYIDALRNYSKELECQYGFKRILLTEYRRG